MQSEISASWEKGKAYPHGEVLLLAIRHASGVLPLDKAFRGFLCLFVVYHFIY